jgi:ferritin-like metal-binding protein YciE
MRLGALNWGTFFQAQPDTPGKLAAFTFAFEHLEIGGYELLKRVASRAGDEATVQVVDRILTEERGAAEKIAAAFDRAVDASLEAQGVPA